MEESAVCAVKGEMDIALEKAKDAMKKEQALEKFREDNKIGDALNLDLTYAVQVHLAIM
jgi:intraflagellar transport protein 88